MLLAIDVGNTHTVLGVHDGMQWYAWRVHTNPARTEDEHGVLLHTFMQKAGLTEPVDAVVIASVVPALEETLRALSRQWLDSEPLFVHAGLELGIEVIYEPPGAVGADRLANAVAAMETYGLPVIVVDFGTATTLDVVSSERQYLGGAILPGVELALEALAGRTAKLPRISLDHIPEPIGRNTPDSLRSGVLLGSAGAIEYLIAQFKQTLGADTHVIATGGLGEHLATLCPSIHRANPLLTLNGLKMIWEKNKGGWS
jgi:type III pantothenate kinase